MTHLVPADAMPLGNGLVRARCGVLVRAEDGSASPECLACVQLDTEDEQAIEALRVMPAAERPATFKPFDPCGGYAPRQRSR